MWGLELGESVEEGSKGLLRAGEKTEVRKKKIVVFFWGDLFWNIVNLNYIRKPYLEVSLVLFLINFNAF